MVVIGVGVGRPSTNADNLAIQINATIIFSLMLPPTGNTTAKQGNAVRARVYTTLYGDLNLWKRQEDPQPMCPSPVDLLTKMPRGCPRWFYFTSDATVSIASQTQCLARSMLWDISTRETGCPLTGTTVFVCLQYISLPRWVDYCTTQSPTLSCVIITTNKCWRDFWCVHEKIGFSSTPDEDWSKIIYLMYGHTTLK